MPEPALSRSPPLLPEESWLRVLPPMQRYVLRGSERIRAAAEQALGLPLPARPCRAETAAERAALWLGPDEWLLLAAVRDVQFAAELRRALEPLDHSLVEVSHRQVALEVFGPAAAQLLASGCPLDLDLARFPVSMCTRTMLAKSEVVLWRTGPQTLRLEVWRSFAPYVVSFLHEAARGMI